MQNCHPCNIGSLGRQRSTTWLSRWTLNFCLYKPCDVFIRASLSALCWEWARLQLSLLFVRSPEVTRVNFHLTVRSPDHCQFPLETSTGAAWVKCTVCSSCWRFAGHYSHISVIFLCLYWEDFQEGRPLDLESLKSETCNANERWLVIQRPEEKRGRFQHFCDLSREMLYLCLFKYWNGTIYNTTCQCTLTAVYVFKYFILIMAWTKAYAKWLNANVKFRMAWPSLPYLLREIFMEGCKGPPRWAVPPSSAWA